MQNDLTSIFTNTFISKKKHRCRFWKVKIGRKLITWLLLLFTFFKIFVDERVPYVIYTLKITSIYRTLISSLNNPEALERSSKPFYALTGLVVL